MHAFLTIERLMHKLNMTPAEVVTLLADVLTDLDRQITEHEAEADLPSPLWVFGADFCPPGGA